MIPMPPRCGSVSQALHTLIYKMPNPWSIDLLVDRVSRYRGRPILLKTADLGRGTGPTGVTIGKDDVDLIVVQEGDGEARHNMISLHELGHLLLGHVDDLRVRAGVTGSVEMWRNSYSTSFERAAESFATRLLMTVATYPEVDPSTEIGLLTDTIR